MQYNDNLFKKLQQGWSDPEDAGIDWTKLAGEELETHISTIFNNGITPMLKDIIGGEFSCNVSMILMPKDVFGQFSVLAHDAQNKEIDVMSISHADIIELYDNFEGIEADQDYDKPKSAGFYSEGQGMAYNNVIIINSSIALKDHGLHLLSHELMHTIANNDAVLALRTNDSMGDEAVNEFFARLATQYLIASGVDAKLCGITTTEEMKSSTDANHDDWGAYGKRIKTSCDICKVVDSTDKLKALKALAEFYFLGKERP